MGMAMRSMQLFISQTALRLSCVNGRDRESSWPMTVCQGGYGRASWKAARAHRPIFARVAGQIPHGLLHSR